MIKRMDYLDGMRGLMALNVVFNHFVIVFFPAMINAGVRDADAFQAFYARSPFSVLTNGNVAVQYFFVLSGFLVASSCFHSEKRSTLQSIAGKVAKRYARLLPMVLAAVLFSYLLMKSGLMFHLENLPSVGNPDFLRRHNNFVPSLTGALYDAFIRAFLIDSRYVAPFWTIRWEFFGYAISLLTVSLLKDKKYRRIAYALIAAALYPFASNFAPFFFGIFVADLYCHPEEDATWLSKYYSGFLNSRFAAIAALVCGIYLASVPNSPAYLHAWLSVLPSMVGSGTIRALGMAVLLFSMLRIASVQNFFQSKPLLFLGRMSFAIYAFHWPIMLSAEHFLFLKLLQRGTPYVQAAVWSLLATLPVIIAVSFTVNQVIENGGWRKLFRLRKQPGQRGLEG